MTKVVYNACFGGFRLSRKAILLGREISGDPKWGGATIKGDVSEDGWVVERDYGSVYDIPRHDPIIVQVVEQLGEEANGICADLRIAEVEGAYRIDEYDGNESVETPDAIDWIYV